MSLKSEVVDSILDEIILKIIGKKAVFLTDDAVSERSDSMYSYPEFNDKDDQVIPGFFKQQSDNGEKDEHVDELSNQEVPKFGIEDCVDGGNISDEIDFYGDDSKKIVDLKKFEDSGKTPEIECRDEDFEKTIDAKYLTENDEIDFYGEDSKKIDDLKKLGDSGKTPEIEYCDEVFKKTIDAKNLTESDEIDFYGDDSKKIAGLKKFEDSGKTHEIECGDEDFEKTIDAKNLTESKESNFEELMVTSNEVTGIPTMAGDGPKQLKRKQDVSSDHDHTKETEFATNYHTLSGITMPTFLNGPPRIGLSKNKLCKSLHKKPKFLNK